MYCVNTKLFQNNNITDISDDDDLVIGELHSDLANLIHEEAANTKLKQIHVRYILVNVRFVGRMNLEQGNRDYVRLVQNYGDNKRW